LAVPRKITPFKFKQFEVHHDRSMKVGTDAVLLGSWVNVEGANRILEVGTGSGVIALMLAQRTLADVQIHAVEMEHDAVCQARENVERSPWPEKIKVHHQPFQSFAGPGMFDLIVSNPPYFVNSQRPPSEKRSQARHTEALSYDELLDGAVNLMAQTGRLAVVLPTVEGMHFLSLAKERNLYTIRQLAFFSRQGKPQERWLFECAFGPAEPVSGTLILHTDGEEWSQDYKNLARDFYLKA